jgi:hypothetical protein
MASDLETDLFASGEPQNDDPHREERQQEAPNDHDDDQRSVSLLGRPRRLHGVVRGGWPRRGWSCSHGGSHTFPRNGPLAHFPLVGEHEPKAD